MPDFFMNVNFLNNYWQQKSVRADKHFDALDKNLLSNINCPGSPREKLKTMYRGTKCWDMHFLQKKVAIEYKTIATEQIINTSMQRGLHLNLNKSIGNRIEEAIGSAIDLKHFDPEYKLGYILVFTLPRNKNITIPKKKIDKIITKFDTIVKNKIYDFFCPLMTLGIDDHIELSGEYSYYKFVNEINSVPLKNMGRLAAYLV